MNVDLSLVEIEVIDILCDFTLKLQNEPGAVSDPTLIKIIKEIKAKMIAAHHILNENVN